MARREHDGTYELFRDCLSTALIEKLSRPPTKPRRRAKSRKAPPSSSPLLPETAGDDAQELGDFIEYIASETFAALPEELKTLDYHVYAKDAGLRARYAPPLTGDDMCGILRPSLDPSVPESLAAYGITDPDTRGVPELLAPVLTAFLTGISTPPPAPSSTRAQATACEICGRNWINLTYHHLIPRFVHAKAVKRGWHREEDLQNVAWLCRACHSKVHQFAGHEDLARHYYTVDLLMEQDEIVQFAKWASRLRWKWR